MIKLENPKCINSIKFESENMIFPSNYKWLNSNENKQTPIHHKSEPNLRILSLCDDNHIKSCKTNQNKLVSKSVSMESLQFQTNMKHCKLNLSYERLMKRKSSNHILSGVECMNEMLNVHMPHTPLQERTSMSPITKSTQRMSKSMQVNRFYNMYYVHIYIFIIS